MAGRVTIICSLLAVLLLSVLGNATEPQGSEKEKVRAVTASASQSLTYQGVLKDASENPIPNAALNIIFRVYDEPDAGDILWQQRLSVKTDKGGYFNAILSDLDLPSDRQYYLSLQVEGDAEMSPRQTLRLPGAPVIAGSDPSPPVITTHDTHWDHDLTIPVRVIWPEEYWGISHRPTTGLEPDLNKLYGNKVYTHINLGVMSETGTSGQHYAYSTVGGGYGNKAKNKAATVAGGTNNQAGGSYSAVSGGASNTAMGTNSFVGGGNLNYATGKYTVVAGGLSNSAQGNYSTVSGGKDNVIWQLFPPTAATIGGGEDNEVGDDYSTIGGGRQNSAMYGEYSTIGGGQNNDADGDHSTIGGGWQNSAPGTYSIIGGGLNNTANGDAAAIAGGYQNTAGGQQSTIAGGGYNTANGNYSTVPGGTLNDAAGANSFAAGKQAKANDSGTFVWADATGANFTSTAANQFLIRANGGVGIGTNAPSKMLDVNGNINVGGGQFYSSNTFKFLHGGTAQTAMVGALSVTSDYLDIPPTNGLYVEGDVGIGTTSPSNELSVSGDADFTGNVGIGTDDPQKPLDVRGWIYGEEEIKIHNSANRSQYAILSWDVTNSRAVLAGNHYQVEERPVYISTGDATFTDDKVGIGTTSPSNELSVSGDADFSGDVGIGTTSPQAKLDIAATGDGVEVLRLSTERSWAFRQLNTGQYTTLELASIGGGGNKDFVINTTGVGKVGIGTTTPDAGAKLHVWGAVTSGGGPTTGIDGKISIKNDAGTVVASIAPDASNHGRIDLYNSSGQAIVSIGEGLDYAEAFSTPYDDLAPGTVMIIDPENPGRLRVSRSAYDKRVAGIVAGANGLSSGVKLGSTDADGEHPVALAGRVYCKVDGKYGAIEPGDLLTTSPNPGFAMVVKDHSEAQGAILGKAMQALPAGDSGEILVLVTLQ